jgi:hypothetical protein
LSLKSQLSYDEAILLKQVTCRPYKRAYIFYLSSLFDKAQIVNVIVCQQVAVNTIHLRYFIDYIHTDVIVKSLELLCMHGNVKFKFTSLFDVAVQKLDMKIVYIKTGIKAYVIEIKC